MLVLISEAVIDNFKGLWLSVVLSLVNCAAIHVIYLIYKYVTVEEFSYLLLIVLGFIFSKKLSFEKIIKVMLGVGIVSEVIKSVLSFVSKITLIINLL